MKELQEKLKNYVEQFNSQDEEIYRQAIPNGEALEWLRQEIPLLDCPDKTIEEIYYFRWWVYRKHLKKTPEGMVVTEFLPPVPWAGAYNTINCTAGFHLEEGRWLKNAKTYLKEYLLFWLKGSGDQFSYSSWLAHAAWQYSLITGDFETGTGLLQDFIRDYEVREQDHMTGYGLCWSDDDRDCMEMSISESGLRPTFNSYQYGDAKAIAGYAELAGQKEIRDTFEQKALLIKKNVQDCLWRDDFFRVIPMDYPGQETSEKSFGPIDKDRDVRELLGYIPWYFGLPDPGYESAFSQLLIKDGFAGRFGFTTAERRHHRYMFENEHECLWNGPVWPYATTQTLKAAAVLLKNYQQDVITSEDYYSWLKLYAQSQHLKKDDGTVLPWIDEDMDPDTGIWTARQILEKQGWRRETGGYERGKDYNHSMFCDLVLNDLLGIGPGKHGELQVNPLIPRDWTYFRVENLWFRDKRYNIIYDKDGTHFGGEKGLKILKSTP